MCGLVFYLNIVFAQLLGKRSATASRWVHGIIDCHLAIFMIQPGVNVFPALLQNFLTQNNG